MDELLATVAKSLTAAGFPTTWDPANIYHELVVAGLHYNIRTYGVRHLYIDGWRVPRINTSTVGRRIIERILATMPQKMRDKEADAQRLRSQQTATKAKKLEVYTSRKLNPHISAAVPLEEQILGLVALACLRTEHFVESAPFIQEAKNGDEFAILALADFLEEANVAGLPVALREACS